MHDMCPDEGVMNGRFVDITKAVSQYFNLLDELPHPTARKFSKINSHWNWHNSDGKRSSVSKMG